VLFREDWTGAIISKVCTCKELDQRIALFNAATVPRLYADAILESFNDRENYSLERVQSALFLRAKMFVPGGKGLGLSGPVGSGKTHLMAAFVRTITLDRGIPTAFVEFSHLLSNIRAGFDKNQGASEILGPLADVPVLVIDELGKSLATDWQTGVMDELISKRYNAKLTTCFTTNYPFSARAPIPSRTRENFKGTLLEERIGERMFSRLSQMAEFFSVDASDYRKEIAALNNMEEKP
jgi:DNA replication protein DnaC